jgi:hypothetical protein
LKDEIAAQTLKINVLCSGSGNFATLAAIRRTVLPPFWGSLDELTKLLRN